MSVAITEVAICCAADVCVASRFGVAVGGLAVGVVVGWAVKVAATASAICWASVVCIATGSNVGVACMITSATGSTVGVIPGVAESACAITKAALVAVASTVGVRFVALSFIKVATSAVAGAPVGGVAGMAIHAVNPIPTKIIWQRPTQTVVVFTLVRPFCSNRIHIDSISYCAQRKPMS